MSERIKGVPIKQARWSIALQAHFVIMTIRGWPEGIEIDPNSGEVAPIWHD